MEFKFLRGKLNFLKDVGRSHVAVGIWCAFKTTWPFDLCEIISYADGVRIWRIKVALQKCGGIICLLLKLKK